MVQNEENSLLFIYFTLNAGYTKPLKDLNPWGTAEPFGSTEPKINAGFLIYKDLMGNLCFV